MFNTSEALKFAVNLNLLFTKSTAVVHSLVTLNLPNLVSVFLGLPVPFPNTIDVTGSNSLLIHRFIKKDSPNKVIRLCPSKITLFFCVKQYLPCILIILSQLQLTYHQLLIAYLYAL